MSSPVTAALLLLLAVSPAAAQTGPVMTTPGSMPGLKNFTLVEKGIYRGSRPLLKTAPLPLGEEEETSEPPPAGDGMESLASLGVKTIVNLQGGDLTSSYGSKVPFWTRIILKAEPGEAQNVIDAEAAEGRDQAVGIDVVNVQLDSLDPVTDDEAGLLEKILGMLAEAVRSGRPLYVHCEHGKDRTGLVVALYRMRFDGWTLDQAAAEMAAMGHTGRLHGHFTGNMDLANVLALHPELVPGGPPAAGG